MAIARNQRQKLPFLAQKGRFSACRTRLVAEILAPIDCDVDIASVSRSPPIRIEKTEERKEKRGTK